MLGKCIADAKAGMPDEGDAAKAAARKQYDDCAAKVDALWATDGGVK